MQPGGRCLTGFLTVFLILTLDLELIRLEKNYVIFNAYNLLINVFVFPIGFYCWSRSFSASDERHKPWKCRHEKPFWLLEPDGILVGPPDKLFVDSNLK